MATITAKFGKCSKCGCDVTGKKVNWDIGNKSVTCFVCPSPAVLAVAASLPTPSKVGLPGPAKAIPSLPALAPNISKLVRIKLMYTFAHNVLRKDGGKGISMYLVGTYTVAPSGKAIFFTGTYDAKESVNCLHCNRQLDNHNSRIVGYGPICCQNLGIDRPNFDKMTGQEIEKLMQTIRSIAFEGWIPKSCVETEEAAEGNAPAASVKAETVTARFTVRAAKPFQTKDSQTVVASESGINWEGSNFKTIHNGSHIMVNKGTYRKLRKVADYGATRKVWEGEGQGIRCLTVDHDGEILSSESLYIPHPTGLF